MARAAETYRAARRNAWRRDKLVWQSGRRTLYFDNGFRLAAHLSLPVDVRVPAKRQEEAAA